MVSMENKPNKDERLIQSIRNGDGNAWSELIARYQGRLVAFVESRLSNRSASEDIVQETFLGFLNSLPNYDGSRPLESYLFSICGYKITDYLRREGRRPTIPLGVSESSSGYWDLPGSQREASSIARSGERKSIEERSVAAALQDHFQRWTEKDSWSKLMCVELLIVRGWPNKRVAEVLGISEQQVANFKFDFLSSMRAFLKKQELSADVFPELFDA